MGTPMAPAIANLFMGMLEAKFLTTSPILVQDRFWKRFWKSVTIQYVEETKNALKTRFYLHRSHIVKNVGTY
ncbi:hypothetical protein ACOMHN_048920 [Nucella lapillus]